VPEKQLRISQSVVEKARARAAKYLINDAEIFGFRVVVYPSGKKVYYYRYRIGGGRGGKPREAKIGDAPGMKADQARKIAGDFGQQRFDLAATQQLSGSSCAMRQQ
jgi:hypothetical protein